MYEVENSAQYAQYARELIQNAYTRAEVQPQSQLFYDERVLSPDPFLYGPLGDGPMIGKWIRFTHGYVRHPSGFEIPSDDLCGVVIGDLHGRVLIVTQLPHGTVFLGWLRPEHYENIQVHENGFQKWLI